MTEDAAAFADAVDHQYASMLAEERFQLQRMIWRLHGEYGLTLHHRDRLRHRPKIRGKRRVRAWHRKLGI